MNNKYKGATPGTWECENPRSNQRIIRGDDKTVVAEVYARTVDEQIANTQLIADAPMLAEQNEKMLTILKGLFNPAITDVELIVHPKTVQRGKDLISEVEG